MFRESYVRRVLAFTGLKHRLLGARLPPYDLDIPLVSGVCVPTRTAVVSLGTVDAPTPLQTLPRGRQKLGDDV